MSRPVPLLALWVVVVLLGGCVSFTLKPARMADLRAGEQVAGISLRPHDVLYENRLRRALESQAENHIVRSLSGFDMLALTGLPEGDFSELRFYLHQSHSDDDQSFEAVMALLPSGGVKRSAEEQAKALGFELGQTVALATELGEVVSTSLPNIYALLRPVGASGPREVHGVLSVLLQATARGFDGNTEGGPTRVGDVLQLADARGRGRPVQGWHCCDSFPAVLLPSQLEAKYSQAIAAGELEVARTHLTMLRGLRSANVPELDARYEALRRKPHTDAGSR